MEEVKATFDFLLSESWWVETIIVALIGGIVTLLVALFALGPQLSALGKQLEGHNKESDSRKAALSMEHGALSKENDALKGKLSYIQNAVTYLKEDRLKELGQREAMKGQALETHKALDVLNASLSHMADLEAKLAEAQKEISALRAENNALRRELASEKGPEEWGPEL